MRRALALVCAAAVSTTLLVQTPTARSAPDPDGAEATLKADADGPVRIRREGGVATFVGAQAGTDVDNPSVNRGTSVSAAARSHVRRYGALVGADRPGTTLRETRRDRSVSGADVVRYQQEVGGLPVVGGDVVVTLTGDHDLGSLNANLSASPGVPAATVTEKEARTTAIALVTRSVGGAAVAESQGRWLFDPEAASWPTATEVRGVWRFEVRVGDGVRRMVFVDDRTGAVLLDVDLIQGLDRVVCDQQNVAVDDPAPCYDGRTETSGPSPVADVEQAFANSGAVAGTYDALLETDDSLTYLIGFRFGDGPRRLSSSVRVCVTGNPCPYANAYWNGKGAFYGQGYAVADDVVGHEMTHGFIEALSGLLYWDQSGAINESLADILGEIVDRQNVSAADGSDDWSIGEDLAGRPPLRNMADPTLRGDPDRMTSPLWNDDAGFTDNGGVHTNSGVGNKAFHLISQGGTFNGQTIAGIDAGDPTLTKSGKLWLEVIQTVTTVTEYFDLAFVLERTCAALAEGGTLTEADCVAVDQAITATEMTSDPVNDPTPHAPRTCPQGLVKVALDGPGVGGHTEGSRFSGAGWEWAITTNDSRYYDDQHYNGGMAWGAQDPATTSTLPLTGSTAIALPAGQPAYLAFRQWHVLDFDFADGEARYWDGGTVEVDDVDDGEAPIDVSGEAWDNGPTRNLEEPNAGRKAFAGNSRGWVGSRVDLSAYAGKNIKPVFTMRSDDSIGFAGWYLDNIEIYTCAPISAYLPSSLSGGGRVGTTYQVPVSAAAVPEEIDFEYQWRRNGTAIRGAIASSYTAVAADLGAVISVHVLALGNGGSQARVLVDDGPVLRGILYASTVGIQGTSRVGRTLLGVRGIWPGGVTFNYRWIRDGKPIAGATGKRYTLTRKDRGHRIQFRVRGVKPGYTTVIRTSRKTATIR